MNYNEIVQYAWLHDHEIADFFGVSLQTVKRWKRLNKAPIGVIQAIRLLAGDCPSLSRKDGWHGWVFSGGLLWSPNKEGFSPGEIRASKLQWIINKQQEHQIKKLKRELQEAKRNKD